MSTKIKIFTQYAEVAFRTEEGCSNPPKPKMPLQVVIEGLLEENVDIQTAVDQFIRDHLVPEEDMDKAREQFEKLYDAGVFRIEAVWNTESTEADVMVAMHMLVWNGTNYVNANELLADEELELEFLGEAE